VTDDVYAFARVSPQDRAIVIFNNGASDATLHVPLAGAQVADGTTLEDAYGSAPAAHVSGGALEVRLPARTVAIYR
jgi:hypothetical protein